MEYWYAYTCFLSSTHPTPVHVVILVTQQLATWPRGEWSRIQRMVTLHLSLIPSFTFRPTLVRCSDECQALFRSTSVCCSDECRALFSRINAPVYNNVRHSSLSLSSPITPTTSSLKMSFFCVSLGSWMIRWALVNIIFGSKWQFPGLGRDNIPSLLHFVHYILFFKTSLLFYKK